MSINSEKTTLVNPTDPFAEKPDKATRVSSGKKSARLSEKGASPRESRRVARWVAKTGILAAVAIVLMYLEFPIPLMPEFLKFDFSEVAVLLAAFALGPWTAVLVELIKNLAHLPATATGGVGELANFLVGSVFVATAGLFYRYHKNKAGALKAMLLGTLAMTVVASLLNYFFLVPFYVRILDFPLEVIINLSRMAGNRLVTDMKTLVLFVFVPFNLFKGIVVSLFVFLLYKRISPLLHR